MFKNIVYPLMHYNHIFTFDVDLRNPDLYHQDRYGIFLVRIK